jgi:hypothetical protein
VLPDVGHFAHVEAPTEVVDLLDDFIMTTSASGAPAVTPGQPR